MSTATTTALMTAEQLLDLPDDDRVDRELIEGELRERPMTTRGPDHGGAEANVVYLLKDWLKRQPEPRGRVFSGEIGVRVRQSPDTLVGIDIAYVAHGTPIGRRKKKSFIDGPPLLAVEVLSPTDRQEDILDKVAQYLANGVRLVWVLEPRFRTVTAYQPGADPVMFNVTQHIDGGSHLPGFRALVADFFAD